MQIPTGIPRKSPSANSSLIKNRKQPATLNRELDQRLLAYLAAAGAAGSTALSLVPQANAKVVFTKTNETIAWNTTTLDLDNDGKPEFKFIETGIGEIFTNAVVGYKGNHIVCLNDRFASALAAGVRVGPGQGLAFHTNGGMVAETISNTTFYAGPWVNVKNRFLGLEFRLSDGVHFGWARFTVTTEPFNVTLTAYAYETIPEKPIVTGRLESDDEEAEITPPTDAGEVSSVTPAGPTLGLLAGGSPALSLWRKEKQSLEDLAPQD